MSGGVRRWASTWKNTLNGRELEFYFKTIFQIRKTIFPLNAHCPCVNAPWVCSPQLGKEKGRKGTYMDRPTSRKHSFSFDVDDVTEAAATPSLPPSPRQSRPQRKRNKFNIRHQEKGKYASRVKLFLLFCFWVSTFVFFLHCVDTCLSVTSPRATETHKKNLERGTQRSFLALLGLSPPPSASRDFSGETRQKKSIVPSWNEL